MDQPPIGRRLLRERALSKSISIDVRALVPQQEGQAGCREGVVKASIRRRGLVPRQHGSFVSGIGSAHTVEAHGEAQDVFHNVQLDFLLLLFVLDVAKAIAFFVADFSVTWTGPSLVVDFLEEGNLVVEVLEIGLGVQTDVAAVLDGVAQRILGKRAPVPAVRTLVTRVGAQPIRQWELVERKLVRPIDLVVVGRHFAALHQAVLDVLAVPVVIVGIVDLRRNEACVFEDECLGGALVVQLKRLGQVVLHDVIPVPGPRLDHLWNDQRLKLRDRIQDGHVVPDLTDLVHPLHLVGRGNLLGEQIKVEVPDEFEVVRIPQETDFREWLPLLGLGLPGIVQAPTMLDVPEVVGVDVPPDLLVVAVVGREICWIQDRLQPLAVVAPSPAASSSGVVGPKTLPVFRHLVVATVSVVSVLAGPVPFELRSNLDI